MLAIYLGVAGGGGGGWTADLVFFPFYRINVSLVILVGLGWLAWRFWRRRAFPATPLDLPILAWTLALLVASLASPDPRLSLETFVYYLVFVLLFYFMVEMERANKALESWLPYILTAGAASIAVGYLQLGDWYLGWFNIGGVEQPIPPATIRIASTLGHPNYFAAYLNLLWPLAVARGLTSPSRPIKAVLAAWCAAALGLIYFTSSRGGWLGSAAASGMLVLLLSLDRREVVQRIYEQLKARRALSLGILATAVVLAGLIGVLMLRQVQHPTHPAGNPRGYIWSVAWEMFRGRPLLGAGPGTYPRAFLQAFSIPPGISMPHAHNFLLNLLSESGLLGAGTGLWLGVTLLWVAIRRWRTGQPGERTLLAGSLAALSGLAVHSLFETPQVIPLVSFVAVFHLARLVASARVEGRTRQAVGTALLAAGWLTVAALGLYSLRGYSALQHGVEAARDGDLAASAAWMDEAVRRDPGLAFFHFQAGQAHARLALDESMQVINMPELESALAAFERGLQIDPSNSLDWASLGELRWASGDRPGGITALEHAASLAPGSADLHLLLGTKYEEAGQTERALEQYGEALELQPEFTALPTFQAPAVRQEALSSFTPAEPEAGWSALAAGDYPRAESIFRLQLGVNDARAYLGLGLSLLGQGKISAAEKALRAAEFIDPENLKAEEALLRWYASPGQEKMAISDLKTAYELSSTDVLGRAYCLGQRNCSTGLGWALGGIFPWRASSALNP